MRFFIWMISFIWGAIDPRAFLFHTKIPFGVRFVGGGFWETDAPSFIRSHHGSSPFYSVFLYQLLASRQKVFLILGRSVFFFFPYNISHHSPKVSGLSGSLVMLVLSRSVINDDCIPERSGAFSQIIPSIP